MFKKIAIFPLFIVVFLVLFSTTLTLPATSAFAWKKGEQLPPVEFDAPLLSWLRQNPKYNKEKTQWFLIDRNWPGPPFNGKPALVVSWSGSFYDMHVFYDSSKQEYVIEVYAPTEYYSLAHGEVTFLEQMSYGTSWGSTPDTKALTIGHIYQYKIDNTITHISKVDPNLRLPQYDINNITTKERCKWHDFACWIGNGITAIGDSISEFFSGFVKVVQNLMEFFSHLFIPGDDNLFLKTFYNLNDYMHKKLGFLTFPFDFIASIVKTLMTVVDSDVKNEWHCTNGSINPAVCSGICVPKVFGDFEFCLKFTQLEVVFPVLWKSIIFVVRFAVVVGLVELMRIKYYSIVRS